MKRPERIEEIIRTYESLPNTVEHGPKDKDGFYVPSVWQDLVNIFVHGIRFGLYRSRDGYFMDAGSGDGRVLALLSCFGYKPIGIELDKDLFKHSKEVIDTLIMRRIIDNNIILLNGDFNEDETYKKAGIDFRCIDHVFHGINSASLQSLNKRIVRESKPGTTLTVYGILNEVPNLNPLRLIQHQRLRRYEGVGLSDAVFYMKSFTNEH